MSISSLALPRLDTKQISARINHIGGLVLAREKDLQPLPDAAVTLMSAEMYRKTTLIGIYRTTITDAQGQFKFSGLPPGDYVILIGDSNKPRMTHLRRRYYPFTIHEAIEAIPLQQRTPQIAIYV